LQRVKPIHSLPTNFGRIHLALSLMMEDLGPRIWREERTELVIGSGTRRGSEIE
jgi:hypothetical protein